MFKITITNIGAAPAHRVFIRDNMLVGLGSPAIQAQKQIADLVRSAADGLGPTLFPGQTLEMDRRYETSLESLKEIEPTEDGTIMFMPELVGVIGYESAFSTAQHQTGFHYHVMRWEPGSPNAKMFFRHLGNIPVQFISVNRSLYGNSLAT
jgi:hypothetical protein